jgi:Na+/H+ antiporter
MQNFEVIILVFSILIVLMAIAGKLKIPSSILLVCVGLTLGIFPALPSFAINPEVVFLLFLPPILYDAASHTSWHDFKAEIKPISTLAILLVFFTSISVAVASHFFIPGFTWPMAFVLGAIISPPDAVAATGIIKGLGLNRRVVTILQGESLVNDASALIAYRFAIAAMTTGTFMIWQAGLEFLILVVGGVVTGVCVGYALVQIHKRILSNSIISTSFTILTPFISYLLAERIHTSGVLAVVSTGLIISWRAPEIFTYHTRIRNRAVWDTAIFLLNGFIFILIGLQLPAILSDLDQYSKVELLGYGLLVSGVTIIVRVLWVFGVAYSPLGKNNKPNEKVPERQS